MNPNPNIGDLIEYCENIYLVTGFVPCNLCDDNEKIVRYGHESCKGQITIFLSSPARAIRPRSRICARTSDDKGNMIPTFRVISHAEEMP